MTMNNIQAKLIVVFKDSLMGTPSGLNYQVLVEGEVIQDDIVTSFDNESNFFIFREDKSNTKKIIVTSSNNDKIITLNKASLYNIKINIVDTNTKTEKAIYSGFMKGSKSLTVTAISPWTKIPLGENVKRDFSSDGNFFEVQYEQKYASKESSEETNISKTVKVVIKDIPRKIVLTALKYRWSTEWAGDIRKISTEHPKLKEKVEFGARTNKCNLFVNDVLTEVGISVPWIEHGKSTYIPFYKNLSPPLAGEWANPSKLTKHWSVETKPLPGDIGAYAMKYTDATGHVGIILTDGVTISAGWYQIEVNDAGFRNKNGTAHGDHDFTVFRRYSEKVIQ